MNDRLETTGKEVAVVYIRETTISRLKKTMEICT
jgi:hypothetical protein